jgi:hypothetical protein
MEILDLDIDVLSLLVMSDEVQFHLSEYVFKQNFRNWTEEHPVQLHKQWLAPLSATGRQIVS